MNIIVIGCGKVGHKIVRQLAAEDDSLMLIDQDEKVLKSCINELDISGIAGNGASAELLREAGASKADLVIACTNTDELNMLCCLLAKRLGSRQTIARVRNPLYYNQIDLLKEDLQLSLAVNPDLTLAEEISRVLIFPSAAKIETFAKGRVELVEVGLGEDSKVADLSLLELYKKYQIKMLVCAVRRNQEVYIPDGSFVLKSGDKIYVAASHQEIERFFKTIGIRRHKVKNVLICGGGRSAYYLAAKLLPLGMNVKIVEKDRERCRELCELLPKATIIHGSGSDHGLLEEEGIEEADAFVALTGIDEENIIMSMYAKTKNVFKVITKVNGESLWDMTEALGVESLVSAKETTANVVSSYVRAMKNSMSSANVETLYRLLDGRVEALEFVIREKTSYTGIPLKDLHVKANHLVACIVRRREIIIPGGNDTLEEGDSVIVVSMGQTVRELQDILG